MLLPPCAGFGVEYHNFIRLHPSSCSHLSSDLSLFLCPEWLAWGWLSALVLYSSCLFANAYDLFVLANTVHSRSYPCQLWTYQYLAILCLMSLSIYYWNLLHFRNGYAGYFVFLETIIFQDFLTLLSIECSFAYANNHLAELPPPAPYPSLSSEPLFVTLHRMLITYTASWLRPHSAHAHNSRPTFW